MFDPCLKIFGTSKASGPLCKADIQGLVLLFFFQQSQQSMSLATPELGDSKPWERIRQNPCNSGPFSAND
jgi:hypothetical protein